MKNKIIIGVVVVAILFGFWIMSSYNSMVKANLAVDTQWAQVETQYQRRFDLIPNLVESVKGMMTQEKDIFISIAKARQGYAGAKTVDEKAAAAGQLESSLGRLLMIVESYPQLASGETVKNLMTQLEGTENRVSVERTRFNDTVGLFNTHLVTFPSNLVASMFGFQKRAFFKADEAAAKAPAVKLN
ncbi:MAG: LemA family protein [Candidatus Nomurabacteria bacterium]